MVLTTTYCSHRIRVTWDDQDRVWYHDGDATICRLTPPWRDDECRIDRPHDATECDGYHLDLSDT